MVPLPFVFETFSVLPRKKSEKKHGREKNTEKAMITKTVISLLSPCGAERSKISASCSFGKRQSGLTYPYQS